MSVNADQLKKLMDAYKDLPAGTAYQAAMSGYQAAALNYNNMQVKIAQLWSGIMQSQKDRASLQAQIDAVQVGWQRRVCCTSRWGWQRAARPHVLPARQGLAHGATRFTLPSQWTLPSRFALPSVAFHSAILQPPPIAPMPQANLASTNNPSTGEALNIATAGWQHVRDMALYYMAQEAAAFR